MKASFGEYYEAHKHEMKAHWVHIMKLTKMRGRFLLVSIMKLTKMRGSFLLVSMIVHVYHEHF